jgi:SulP family sulfate permease
VSDSDSGKVTQGSGSRWLAKYVPMSGWLPKYQKRWLGLDVMAGIAVASLAIPTALGYAGIAHVPVEVGLYALPAALLLYAIFGSSRQLSVGPSSTVAVMSGAVLIGFGGTSDTATAIAITAGLALSSGVILVAAGWLRLGWATDFISKPVVTGFTFGLGMTVIGGEIPHLLGLPSEPSSFFPRVVESMEDLDQISLATLTIGAVSLAILFIGGARRPRWPWALGIMAVSIVAAEFVDPTDHGVEVIGPVPGGLPDFGFPDLSGIDLVGIVLGGAAIAMVGVGESLSAGRLFAAKGGYRINSDQEFVGTGVANIGAGLSGGMAVGGSISRTAAGVAAGARTQVAALAAMASVVVVLIALTDLLTFMPRVILSAVVISSVWFLLDVKTIRGYAKIRRNDFVAAVTALLGVLLLGPLYGLLTAVGISLLGLAYRSSQVLLDPIGRIPTEKAGWGSLIGHPERVAVPGLLVLRLGSPIYWANSARTHELVLMQVDAYPDLRGVVLDLEATGQLDITSLEMLEALLSELRAQDIDLYLARVLPLTDIVLEKGGFYSELGPGHSWHSITHTVEEACRGLGIPDVLPDSWPAGDLGE